MREEAWNQWRWRVTLVGRTPGVRLCLQAEEDPRDCVQVINSNPLNQLYPPSATVSGACHLGGNQDKNQINKMYKTRGVNHHLTTG